MRMSLCVQRRFTRGVFVIRNSGSGLGASWMFEGSMQLGLGSYASAYDCGSDSGFSRTTYAWEDGYMRYWVRCALYTPSAVVRLL